MPVLIDCHGPDHGLSVVWDGSTVTIADYSEACEANLETGRWEGYYRETTVDIADLLNPKGEHRGCYQSSRLSYGPDGPLKGREKLHEIIIEASIQWMAYWGFSSDETTIVDVETDGGACGFFGEYWGERETGTDAELLIRCSVCAETRRKDLADAVCEYAYGATD